MVTDSGNMTNALYAKHIAILQQQAEHILAEQGFDRLLIHSGRTKMRFQDDHGPPFRAHPYFVHWLPLPQHEDGLLEIRPGHKPRVYLHVPDDFWHAPPPPPENWWADEFEIVEVQHTDQWRTVLDEVKATVLIAEAADFAQLGQHAALNPEKLLQQLDESRTVKTDWQIHCIRESNKDAVKGHRAAEKAFFAGKSELEIHFEYLHASLHEPNELSYNSIVALNEHAAILHYQYRDEQAPSTHNSLLLDAGADYLGYAADITRTYVNGDFAASETFRGLIEAVDDMQQRLVEQVQPGKDYVELNQQAHRGIAEILSNSKICSMSIDAMLEANLTTRFLPHGLGHFIGVQVHDVGGKLSPEGSPLPPPEQHPFLRLTRKLKQANVLTIEPGLYFIPSLLNPLRESNVQQHLNWSLIDQLIPYGGIRVEDDIVVRGKTPENLTRKAFSTVD